MDYWLGDHHLFPANERMEFEKIARLNRPFLLETGFSSSGITGKRFYCS